MVVDGKIVGPVWQRAAGDENKLCGVLLEDSLALDLNSVRVDEGSLAENEFDIVPLDVLIDEIPFVVHDMGLAVHEVLDRDVLFDAVIDSVESTLAKVGKIECGFSESFARDGACVDAGAPHTRSLFNDRSFLPEVCRLSGPLLACRAGTDDDQIKVVRACH